jgi:hypothetical protein
VIAITPVFRKRHNDTRLRFDFVKGEHRARNYNYAEITRNRALFSEITENAVNFGDTIYRYTQPSVQIQAY